MPLLDVPFANPQVEREYKIREAARTVASLALSRQEDIDLFMDQMAAEHRTHQQLFTRLCLNWFHYNSENPFFDLRNEFTIKVSKIVKDTLSGVFGSTWHHTPYV